MDSKELRQETAEGWAIQYKPLGDTWRLWRRGEVRKLNGFMLRKMRDDKLIIRTKNHSAAWQGWEFA